MERVKGSRFLKVYISEKLARNHQHLLYVPSSLKLHAQKIRVKRATKVSIYILSTFETSAQSDTAVMVLRVYKVRLH